MQFLNSLIIATEIAFAVTFLMPVALTALYVLFGLDLRSVGQSVELTNAIPKLDSDLDGDVIMAEVDRVLSRPAMPQTVNQGAVLTIPVTPDFDSLNAVNLRKMCSDAGVKWRNAHGKGLHLKRTEMIAALS